MKLSICAFARSEHIYLEVCRVHCNKDDVKWMMITELSAQVPGDGADGCKPVPGDSDGAGPREAFLPALPDAVWDQTPACCWHHSQGETRN